MEVEILKNEDKLLEFELKNEDHSFSNLLRKKLWIDKDTKFAAYKIEHPLIGSPHFKVESKKEKPIKIVDGALDSIIKDCSELNKKFNKAL